MKSIMKNKKIIILLVAIVLLIPVIYFAINQQKVATPTNEIENKNKTEFSTKLYDIDSIGKAEGIDLETEKRYKEKFNEYQDKLKEDIEKYNQGGQKEEEKPNPDYFVEKARYANYLGQTDWAIEILNEVFNYYNNSSVAWNNLAKIYEGKKEYEKANEYYQKIIDAFGEETFWTNYYYISKNYMIIGDKEKTEEAYQKYREFGGSDSQIDEYLAE